MRTQVFSISLTTAGEERTLLGWGGLIGRMISFTLEKLAGKKIDLAMDDRRKAARMFLRLYHAVSDLEVLSNEIIVELQAMSAEDNPTVSGEWLRDISIAIDETSERFLEATQKLREILEIFDPVLAITVSGLEAHKFSFLIIAANGFEPITEEQGITAITYTRPSDQLAAFDLMDDYNWFAKRYPLDYTKPIEWPSGVTLSFLQESDIEEDHFKLNDPDSMLRLAGLLGHHSQALTAARLSLASFLRERFTLEDLLAVQKPISQFDRIHAMNRMSDAVAVSYNRWFAGKPVRRIRTRRQESNEKTTEGN
ncbi:MAG: hypothetical protein ACLPXM_15265 [Terriglobales bacterium]